MLHKLINGLIEKGVKTLDGDNLSYRREALREIYVYSPRTLKLLMISTLTLCALYYSYVPFSILCGWAGALIFLTVYRLNRLQASRSDDAFFSGYPDEEKIATRYRHYYLLAMLSALLISLAPLLFLPHLHESAMRYILIVFIMGTSTGAVIAFYTSRFLILSYLLLLNLPLILYYLTSVHQPNTGVFALVIILYNIVIALLADKTRTIHFELFRKRRHLHLKERELNALFDQTPTPIFYFDTNLKLRKWNRALEKLFDVYNAPICQDSFLPFHLSATSGRFS